MKKNQYEKWRKRYIRNSKPTDFTLDMKSLSLDEIFILRNIDKIEISKRIRFASLTRKEYDIFNNWTKKEQLQFLEDYFNYYMAMMC